MPSVTIKAHILTKAPAADGCDEVELLLNGQVVGTGSGSSKKRAEQAAAKAALELFGVK